MSRLQSHFPTSLKLFLRFFLLLNVYYTFPQCGPGYLESKTSGMKKRTHKMMLLVVLIHVLLSAHRFFAFSLFFPQDYSTPGSSASIKYEGTQNIDWSALSAFLQSLTINIHVITSQHYLSSVKLIFHVNLEILVTCIKHQFSEAGCRGFLFKNMF